MKSSHVLLAASPTLTARVGVCTVDILQNALCSLSLRAWTHKALRVTPYCTEFRPHTAPKTLSPHGTPAYAVASIDQSSMDSIR